MDDSLHLTYDLYRLPTAQHRAGLAGLLIHTDTMRRRGLTGTPEATTDGSGTVRLTLSKTSLTLLLNDLYDASTVEVSSPKPRKKDGTPLPPLRTETVSDTNKRTGKETSKTIYYYPQVTPRAPFLQSMDMPELWLKLWREVVWSMLRSIPATRHPYEQRSANADVADAGSLWNDLSEWHKPIPHAQPHTTEMSSSLYLGAQTVNAEKVKFVGSPDQNLLLHFWPVVMGVGEARKLVFKDGKLQEEPTGYVITVPDVNDLEGFQIDFAESVAQLDQTRAGYRPRAALLSLPEEGGLRYLTDLAMMAKARALSGPLRFTVGGVEVYQLIRPGNGYKLLSIGRLPARPGLVEHYDQIGRRYYDLTFRGQVIRNLLRDQPWYDGFHRLFAKQALQFFVGPSVGRFASDVSRKFRTESEIHREQEVDMDADAGAVPVDLSQRVHNMIRQYVNGRTEAKAGLKWADFKDSKIRDPETGKERVNVPEKYRETREKVCQDAFLSIRACRAREDFVTYFTGTICAVPQYIPPADYQALATALLGRDDQWEHVKALSMLALSALSRA